MIRKTAYIFILTGLLLISINLAQAVSSTNYSIPEYSVNQGSADLSSQNFNLVGVLAPLVGQLASTNYGLDAGFPSQTGGTITLSLNSSTASFGAVTPGVTATATTTATVTTDTGGYALAIQKTGALTHTDDTTTVSDYSGSIATPTTWNGTGFGMTVSSGTALESKWGSGTKYAAIPTNTATTFHSVTTPLAVSDATQVTYRLDTSSTQTAGSYSARLGYSAVALP